MSLNHGIELSASGRVLVNAALKVHPAWNHYRELNELSLATITKDQRISACDALDIDIGAIIESGIPEDGIDRSVLDAAQEAHQTEEAALAAKRILKRKADAAERLSAAKAAPKPDPGYTTDGRDGAPQDPASQIAALLTQMAKPADTACADVINILAELLSGISQNIDFARRQLDELRP